MKNLILITNDDGVRSPGLIAAVRALRGLGELMIAAPRQQQSSSGRAFYWRERRARKKEIVIGRTRVTAVAVDASPAVTVRYALMLSVPRRPALVVSGINYGENLGSGLTISGTVGAALEAAADGVPALAVSLETARAYHLSHSLEVDFGTAAYWTRRMAEAILKGELGGAAPIVNVNVPSDATPQTAWRATRASHQSYFKSVVENGRFTGYDVIVARDELEADSDIQALLVDRVVSVTPLTYDLTAAVDLGVFGQAIKRNVNGRTRRN